MLANQLLCQFEHDAQTGRVIIHSLQRQHSAAMMLAGMQGFRELFAGANPAKKLLRDIGLKLADTLPGVKPQLLRQAMGLNDLPDWLR